MPGDVIFILAGCLPFLYIAFQGLRYARFRQTTQELPQDSLFTEQQPVSADGVRPD